MQEYEKAVFISYAWAGEREEIVNQIDESLKQRGIKIIRDKRELGYKGSIQEFMERIGRGSCIIIVVSDKYLRSPNCMFELLEIADNLQFYDRVFPIVLSDANIYDPVQRIEYVKHWETKREELARAIKTVDPANLQGIRDDMDRYDRIRDRISGLTSILKDMNTLTPEMHQDTNFGILYSALEKRMSEEESASAGLMKESRGSKTSPVDVNASEKAVDGLKALSELMERSSDIKNAVIEFQTDFNIAHKQVDQLGDYKDLHDLLHRLQFHCYNGVIQASKRFPPDELTLDNLTDYALTLDGIVDELKLVASRPAMQKQEINWIDEVNLIKGDLHKAIDTLDESLLKKVIWRMHRLLGSQPARINTLLNKAANDLRLSGLLNALTRVYENFTTSELDAKKVGAFQSGIEGLNRLHQSLSILVEDHDQWQALDNELRRIESSLDHDLTELQMSWPDVKLKAEPLYINCPDEWANAIKKESNALDEALRTDNQIKSVRGFRNYQRRAVERFYRVDVELKNLCGNLRQIGVPLASVLEMIK